MRYDLSILHSEEEIKERIKILGAEITKDYRGKDLYIICLLRGAAMFMCDLVKCIDNEDLVFDFMDVSSYGAGTSSSGVVKIIKDLDASIEGKDVLIVEDIIDTGYTLKHIKELLGARKPNSLEVCVLLNKPDRRKVDVNIKYIGFEIPDKFIVGYGMDYDQRYRNLPYIAVVNNPET